MLMERCAFPQGHRTWPATVTSAVWEGRLGHFRGSLQSINMPFGGALDSEVKEKCFGPPQIQTRDPTLSPSFSQEDHRRKCPNPLSRVLEGVSGENENSNDFLEKNNSFYVCRFEAVISNHQVKVKWCLKYFAK